MYYHYLNTPIGQLTLFATDAGLSAISFPTSKKHKPPGPGYQKNATKLKTVAAQLKEYFSGKRKQFTIPLDMHGTDFQCSVWDELRSIQYGETMSYGEVAKKIGRPKASRAVGAANGINKIPIIIPCHRVIGSNQTLTGYAGGLKIKQFLLDLEAQVLQRNSSL